MLLDRDVTPDGRPRPNGQFASCVVCPDCGRCELCGTMARAFIKRSDTGVARVIGPFRNGATCRRCTREKVTGFRAAGAMHIVEEAEAV